MTYGLIIGNKNYSSWSMRAWLLLRHLGVDFEERLIGLYVDGARDAVRDLGGETGLVPVLVDADLAVWDTLAIFEYLHERHRGVWPEAPADRARARSLSGEMHSGFVALRTAMPCNTRARGRLAEITPAVEQDIQRLSRIWERSSPWLFGAFGGADIMFAPVATRLQTYGVELEGRAAAYCDNLLRYPLVVEWVAAAETETAVIEKVEIGR